MPLKMDGALMKIKILTMLLIISGTVQSQVIEEDKKYYYDVARIMFFEDGLVTSEQKSHIPNNYIVTFEAHPENLFEYCLGKRTKYREKNKAIKKWFQDNEHLKK